MWFGLFIFVFFWGGLSVMCWVVLCVVCVSCCVCVMFVLMCACVWHAPVFVCCVCEILGDVVFALCCSCCCWAGCV